MVILRQALRARDSSQTRAAGDQALVAFVRRAARPACISGCRRFLAGSAQGRRRRSKNPKVSGPSSSRRHSASRCAGLSRGTQRSRTAARVAGRPRRRPRRRARRGRRTARLPQTPLNTNVVTEVGIPAGPHRARKRRRRSRSSTSKSSGSRSSDDHRHRQGRGRRDRRRSPGAPAHLLDARLCRRPDQHALQRYQDRPVDHDGPPHGHRQPRAGRDPQGAGLAAVGHRRDRRRDQLRDQGAAHRTDRQRGLHVVRFVQGLPRRLWLRRQHH